MPSPNTTDSVVDGVPALSEAFMRGFTSAFHNLSASGKAVIFGILGFFLFILLLRVWSYFRRGGTGSLGV